MVAANTLPPARPCLRILVVIETSDSWIIERLMTDLAREFQVRGHHVDVGTAADFEDHHVVLSSRALMAQPVVEAPLNFAFVTHIDDRAKEAELRSLASRFDGLICMSDHDAKMVQTIIGDRSPAVGLDLPFRGERMPLLRVAVFSAVYKDGRKNERWLVDYVSSLEPANRRLLEFILIGKGWWPVAETLSNLGAGVVLVDLRRDVPGEYARSLDFLATASIMAYMGFDGGAMSVYDALSVGIPVVVPDASYHRGLGPKAHLFSTQIEFNSHLEHFRREVQATADILEARGIRHYVDQLEAIWIDTLTAGEYALPLAEKAPIGEVRRGHKRVSIRRLLGTMLRTVRRQVD